MKRKFCVITGTRAEFGLLYWLMKEIQMDEKLQLQIIATAAHLSPEFGKTVHEIEKEFKVDKKVEMLLSADTTSSIAKSAGLGMIGLADALHELKPDMVVLLGDRFETLAAAFTSAISRIPVAHIHGGELTEGAVDESFRHAITKLSNLHFTSTEEYRKRVIQLGEQPHRVYNVGAVGIDNFIRLSLLNRDELEKRIDFSFGKKNLLITFHPVTLEESTAERQFGELIEVCRSLEDTKIIFTKANGDADGRIINEMIDRFVQTHPDRSVAYVSMGQLNYLSAMKHVDAVVGNSSSGIIEAPSLKVATVNIGDRQKGRIKAVSVIDCLPDSQSILAALQKVYQKDFLNVCQSIENPYGNGGASAKISQIISSIPLDGLITKPFYDIPVNV